MFKIDSEWGNEFSLNIGDFMISFPIELCVILFLPVSSVTPSERYKLKYICMKAKDILAFIVVESSQVFGPFPQSVGDH